MGPAERRAEIMRILCRKRHDTVKNLAVEFGVDPRTILRDIEILALTEPIYTVRGRYGGVFVIDNYSIANMYMSEKELSVLHKISEAIDNGKICSLNDNEQVLLKNIISKYTKPTYRKE